MTTLSVRYAPTLLMFTLISLSFHSLSVFLSFFSHMFSSLPHYALSYVYILPAWVVIHFLWLSVLIFLSKQLTEACSEHTKIHPSMYSTRVFNAFHTHQSPQRPPTTSYTWQYKPRNPYNHLQVSRVETVSLPGFAFNISTVQVLGARFWFSIFSSWSWSSISCIPHTL